MISQQTSLQDWDQWARHPMTQAFVRELQETVELAKDRWSYGSFASADVAETVQSNTIALSGIDMLRQVMNLIEEHKIPVEGAQQ